MKFVIFVQFIQTVTLQHTNFLKVYVLMLTADQSSWL
jgi:hypothetical protein